MKKIIAKASIAFFLVMVLILGASSMNSGNCQNHDLKKKSDDETVCKWSTRQTGGVWEAYCHADGVGYTCTCGTVKTY